MNLNLYGHDGRWLMVDCGITFSQGRDSVTYVQMPDPEFIIAHQERLCGLIVTHAHEDHVGAIAHLWKKFNCPIYTTAFTAEILRRKLADAGLADTASINIVKPQARIQLDVFNIEWISLTHSTPETQGLLIRTPAANIFHTADWKLDPDPVVGPPYPESKLKSLAQQNITAMVCDSTNATEEGSSISEGDLRPGLLDIIEKAPGKVVIACFGSNVARLQTIASVAHEAGRYPCLLGRSLHNFHGAAVAASIWNSEYKFTDPKDINYLSANEILIIATGSQGEPRAALDRLSKGNHPVTKLTSKDTVVFSSRVIPGNEESIAALVRRLDKIGVTIIEDNSLNTPIHASGHPPKEELKKLYDWVQPKIAIPVHGEPQHLRANAEIAKNQGISHQMVGLNGDLYMLSPKIDIKRGAVFTGRLGLNKKALVKLSKEAY